MKFKFFLLLLSVCYYLPCQFAYSQALKDFATFPIGAAISPTRLFNNANYQKLVLDNFNSISADNVFKMNYILKADDKYSFDSADTLVNFATENNIRIHGHTLIYDHAVPKWLTFKKYSPEQWETLYKTYIFTVVRHFKGRVYGWDVVNEAFNKQG